MGTKINMNNLNAFFAPKSIAIVGASTNPDKLGSIILQNMIESGFRGDLYAINPKNGGQTILGKPCLASLSDYEKEFDLAVIVVPGKFVEGVVDEAITTKTKNLIIISAGFGEVGNEALEQTIKEKCDDHNIGLLGPNCLGAIFPKAKVNASFSDGFPMEGGICFASQSGAFCTAMLDWAEQKEIGFSHILSLGNKSGISEVDILKTLKDDDQVEMFVFYLESLASGPEFLKLIREVSPKKPVIILEPGRSAKAAAASASHTGSLAPNSRVLEMAYRQSGAIQTFSMRDMFSVVETLQKTHKKSGPNIAILTNAGGVGVLTTDEIEDHGLSLTELEAKTITQLEEVLPDEANTHNPIDIIGDARADRYQQALEVLIYDKNVDQILVLLTPQRTTEVEETAKIIAKMSTYTDKNIVASFVGGARVKPGIELLEERHIPHFEFPIDAVRTMQLKYKSQNQKPAVTLTAKPDSKISNIIKTAQGKKLSSLYQDDVRTIMSNYGLDVPGDGNFTDIEEAATFAKDYFPNSVVMKISSPEALHKSDLKGVFLNINNEEKFRAAWENLQGSIKIGNIPNASIQVQEQIPEGTEIILGMNQDQNFGPVLLFGAGGIYTEVFSDTTLRILPTADFQEMIGETRVSKILNGTRGENPKAVSQLIKTMEKVQQLVIDHPEIQAIDANPIIVTEDRAVCVDFKILI